MSGVGRGRGWHPSKIQQAALELQLVSLKNRENPIPTENKAPALFQKAYHGRGRGIRMVNMTVTEESTEQNDLERTEEDEDEMILIAEIIDLGTEAATSEEVQTITTTQSEKVQTITTTQSEEVQDMTTTQSGEIQTTTTTQYEEFQTITSTQGVHDNATHDVKFEELRKQYEGKGNRGSYYNILLIPSFHQNGNALFKTSYTRPLSEQKLIENENDQAFYPHPNVHTWLTRADSFQSKLIPRFLKYCIEYMNRPGRNWKPYTVEHLPCFSLIQADTNVKCQILRCCSPSDFHVIFQQKVDWFNVELYNRSWLHFFEKREKMEMRKKGTYVNNKQLMEQVYRKYCFNSPIEVYHGISVLLQKFLETLEESPNEKKLADEVELFVGDLVIVTKQEEEEDQIMAYRGVIIEPTLVLEDADAEPRNAFLVYLLDTGEIRVVARSQLVQLPKAFIGFRPLAVKCSLRGVKKVNWGAAVKMRLQELFHPNSELSSNGPFFLELYRAKRQPIPKEIEHSRTLTLLHQLAYCDSYEAKIYVRLSLEGSTEISDVLIQERLANPAACKDDCSSDSESLPSPVESPMDFDSIHPSNDNRPRDTSPSDSDYPGGVK